MSNKAKEVKKENVKNENLTEGLEVTTTKTEETNGIDFSNREYLENNEPNFDNDFTSAKYDEKREPKVQAGLLLIAELMGDKVNPLLLLLAKWWEVKPARTAIKKMIDAEARENNTPEDVYLQIVLRENVDKLASIQNAVDRLRYGITYFKPRSGVGSKEVFKPLQIDGKNYNVSLLKLAEAKQKFGDDTKEIKKYLKEVSKEMEIETL